jgi:glycerate 2-kinase
MKKDNLKKLRRDANDIFQYGLKAVDPVEAIKSHVKLEENTLKVDDKEFNLSRYKRIFLIGGGKAGASMSRALEELLGDRIDSGIVNVKYGHLEKLKKTKINEASHPVPDEAGVKGTLEIIELAENKNEDDLIICVISGGGSALMPHPSEGITLEEKQKVTKLLLDCGANIKEINTIRKHISRIKGGQLSRIAYPATIITLILSDVIGDDLQSIASGLTVPDETTYEDCLNILNHYKLMEKIPSSVKEHLEKGLKKIIEETPKKGDPVFHKTHNFIIGSNILAVKAAEKRAKQLAYNSLILSTFIEGETKDIALMHAAITKEVLSSKNPVEPPACIISGGETTVTIRGNGKGGRNMEFVLACSMEISNLRDTVVLSAGTDGTDGPTDSAGAIGDNLTISRAKELGLDPSVFLNNNDSYHFFKQLDDLLIIGPTNTNVMDLRILLIQ